jgi:hypothetical protein
MKSHNVSTSAFLPRTGQVAAVPGLIKNQRKKCLLSAPLLILAVCGIGQTAEAQINGKPINSCGTVISEPGYYIVSNSLQSSSETVDCIQIASPGVGLAVHAQMTGPGGSNVTAAGIRVTSKATGVSLNLANATIEGFGVGLVIEGSGVLVSEGSVKGNAAQGVLISNATNVTIDDLNSTSNGQSGLELSNASGVLVEGQSMLESNGGNGLWVHSSSGNQFVGLSAYTNKQDGIYVGEADAIGKRDKAEDAQPLSSPKTSNTVSQHNVFNGGGGLDAGTMLQNDVSGIVIGAGDSANIVIAMNSFENGDKDAEDKNENCTLNTWTQNQFGTNVSPSCIH